MVAVTLALLFALLFSSASAFPLLPWFPSPAPFSLVVERALEKTEALQARHRTLDADRVALETIQSLLIQEAAGTRGAELAGALVDRALLDMSHEMRMLELMLGERQRLLAALPRPSPTVPCLAPPPDPEEVVVE